MNKENLAKRLLFAAWAAPLGWVIINSPGYTVAPETVSELFLEKGLTIFPGHILAIVLAFMGTMEYLRMLSARFPKNGFWLIYIYVGIQLGSYFAPLLSLSARFDTFILFILVALEAFIWGKQSGRWRRASLLFSGAVFMSMAGYACLSFYGNSFQQMFESRFHHWSMSQMGIIIVTGSIFFCDTAAFFIGSLFGKHHFSSVSPHKTIEGSIAGLIAAVITSTAGWLFLTTPAAHEKFSLFAGDHIIFGIIMGIIIGVFAQAGDLVVSLMKRYFRFKDASTIIPGHGGILDRFDSVFFTAPVIQLFILFVNRLVQ